MYNLEDLQPELRSELEANCQIVDVERGTELLRFGQYVKVVPIVLEGLVKVFSQHEDRELLLYYITPSESCIMSFAASLKNDPSMVMAVAEEDSKLLLMPSDRISDWLRSYPDINRLFYQQFNLRYQDLLNTIDHVLFNRMDVRLFDFLKERSELTGKNPLKISHRMIAEELGTAREVISRVMKKLEAEGKVQQHTNTIELL